MGDMTHSYVQHHHIWSTLHTCDMTHSCVWRDSLLLCDMWDTTASLCVWYVRHDCGETLASVRRASLICAKWFNYDKTWLVNVWDMYATWLLAVSHTTHSSTRRDSFKDKTRLIMRKRLSQVASHACVRRVCHKSHETCCIHIPHTLHSSTWIMTPHSTWIVQTWHHTWHAPRRWCTKTGHLTDDERDHKDSSSNRPQRLAVLLKCSMSHHRTSWWLMNITHTPHDDSWNMMTHGNTLQHTATHCHTLHHTATHCIRCIANNTHVCDW